MTTIVRGRALLSCGAAILALCAQAPVQAQSVAHNFNIPAQDLGAALRAYAQASGQQVVFDGAAARGKISKPLAGTYSGDDGVRALLAGSGLTVRRSGQGVLLVTIAAPPPISSPSEPVSSIGEIVVTAQKKSERISKVPVSITALNQQALDDRGVKSMADIGRLAPGLSFQTTSFLGETNVSIRGVSSIVGTPTTGIYIDDVPIQALSISGQASNTYPKVFDLDRVEVLRGPQGALFGAGSEGGAIRFITPQPSLTRYSGLLDSEIAYTDRGDPSYELGGAVGGPVVDDKVAFRASAWWRQDGGYVDRLSPDTGKVVDSNANWSRSKVARLALLLSPTENLKITPSIYYQDVYQNDKSFSWEGQPSFSSINKIQQPDSDEFTLSSLNIEYDLPKLSLTSITSYFDRNNSHNDDYSYFEAAEYQGGPITIPGLPGFVSTNRTVTNQHNLTEEFRAASTDSRGAKLSWVGGVFYQNDRQGFRQSIDEDIDALSEAIFGGPALAVFGEGPVGPGNAYSYLEHGAFVIDEVAAFGNLSYHITDKLKATAGVRVAHNRFSFVDAQDGPEAGGPHRFTGAQSETPVTPKFGLSYQFAPETMVYAGAAKGYRIGGANESLATNLTCAPSLQTLGLTDAPAKYYSDSVWSYELGAKSRLPNRIVVDASLYWIDWSNIQGNVFLPSCGYSYTTNLGQAVSRGFDLAVQMPVIAGFQFSATLGYDDARYSKTSSVASASGAPTILAKYGDEIGVPAWTATVSGEYGFALIPNYETYVRADYTLTGAYHRTPSATVFGYDPGTRDAPATNLVALRAGLRDRRRELSLFVNNLLNSTTSLARIHPLARAPGYTDLTFRPLTVGLTGRYRF